MEFKQKLGKKIGDKSEKEKMGIILPDEVEFVKKKMISLLKKSEISIWESILYNELTLTNESYVSTTEFKSILNSMCIDLSLKE